MFSQFSSNSAQPNNNMYDQSLNESQYSSGPQIPPEQKKKEQLQLKRSTKNMCLLLLNQTRAIHVSQLMKQFFTETQNLNIKTQNVKKRFHDIIRIMKEAKFIKEEKKEIILYTKNTKMSEKQQLKMQCLQKEYYIEQQKAKIAQLKDYKDVMEGIIKRNKKDTTLSSKRITIPFGFFLYENSVEEAKVYKPQQRIAKNIIQILDEKQQYQIIEYYQVLYNLMSDREPIKINQE